MSEIDGWSGGMLLVRRARACAKRAKKENGRQTHKRKTTARKFILKLLGENCAVVI